MCCVVRIVHTSIPMCVVCPVYSKVDCVAHPPFPSDRTPPLTKQRFSRFRNCSPLKPDHVAKAGTINTSIVLPDCVACEAQLSCKSCQLPFR